MLQNTKAIQVSYLHYEKLPIAYSGSLALIYLALYEGFGMPVCESMASGGPVIVGREWNISSDAVCCIFSFYIFFKAVRKCAI